MDFGPRGDAHGPLVQVESLATASMTKATWALSTSLTHTWAPDHFRPSQAFQAPIRVRDKAQIVIESLMPRLCRRLEHSVSLAAGPTLDNIHSLMHKGNVNATASVPRRNMQAPKVPVRILSVGIKYG